jgi:hypothetical protein
MSTDEKANEVSAEAADQEPITPSSETDEAPADRLFCFSFSD